jgi:hypothetical protein
MPSLMRRFDLASLVTAYPLGASEQALAAVARGAVMEAVFAVGPV